MVLIIIAHRGMSDSILTRLHISLYPIRRLLLLYYTLRPSGATQSTTTTRILDKVWSKLKVISSDLACASDMYRNPGILLHYSRIAGRWQ